jgi:hypothetical protein
LTYFLIKSQLCSTDCTTSNQKKKFGTNKRRGTEKEEEKNALKGIVSSQSTGKPSLLIRNGSDIKKMMKMNSTLQ